MDKKEFTVSEVINSIGISSHTWIVFVLLAFAMIFDGYDYMVVNSTNTYIARTFWPGELESPARPRRSTNHAGFVITGQIIVSRKGGSRFPAGAAFPRVMGLLACSRCQCGREFSKGRLSNHWAASHDLPQTPTVTKTSSFASLPKSPSGEGHTRFSCLAAQTALPSTTYRAQYAITGSSVSST